MKRSQVKVLPPQDMIADPEKEMERAREKRLKSVEARRTLSTLLPDKLANSTFWVRNQAIPGAKEMFPVEWRMQYAELFYPHAEGGPLYMDMPKHEFDVALCKRKLEACRKKGIRYVYLTTGMGENEARMMLEGIE